MVWLAGVGEGRGRGGLLGWDPLWPGSMGAAGAGSVGGRERGVSFGTGDGKEPWADPVLGGWA